MTTGTTPHGQQARRAAGRDSRRRSWHHRPVPRDRRIAPRKPPSTRAGADIIESVLAAASQVLDERGLDGFTTNQVAERAGVSIGSLYQYFPNKDALLAELARRLERRPPTVEAEVHRPNPSRRIRTPSGPTRPWGRKPAWYRPMAKGPQEPAGNNLFLGSI